MQIDDAVKNKKIKTMIEFNKSECNSIKSIVVKGNASNNKLSLKSFIYDMIDAFCFPNQKIQEIYNYYQIERCFLYQNLNDTDNTSLFFLFICKVGCFIAESEARNIIFKRMKNSKIAERLDVSDEFWK